MKLTWIGICCSALFLSSALSCNDQGFNGATASDETLPPAAAEAIPETPEPNIMEQAIEVSSTQAQPAVCSEKLNYDPSQILCSLKQNDRKTVWDMTPPWTDRVNSLKNRAAAWISPLAAVENANKTSIMCPFVPDSDRLIFVSNFILSEDTDVTLEAVIDDIGSVRLWKNADSKQQVYISPQAAKVDGAIRLSKGFYSIVADGADVGKAATGMIMTIFNAQGGIIRQTEASAKDWCIFRVKADTDVETFVNAASLCRSCMVGSRATGP